MILGENLFFKEDIIMFQRRITMLGIKQKQIYWCSCIKTFFYQMSGLRI